MRICDSLEGLCQELSHTGDKTLLIFSVVNNLSLLEKEKIIIEALRMGSSRDYVSHVRAKIAYHLVEDFGIPSAEVACQLGVSTSAISKAVKRATKE